MKHTSICRLLSAAHSCPLAGRLHGRAAHPGITKRPVAGRTSFHFTSSQRVDGARLVPDFAFFAPSTGAYTLFLERFSVRGCFTYNLKWHSAAATRPFTRLTAARASTAARAHSGPGSMQSRQYIRSGKCVCARIYCNCMVITRRSCSSTLCSPCANRQRTFRRYWRLQPHFGALKLQHCRVYTAPRYWPCVSAVFVKPQLLRAPPADDERRSVARSCNSAAAAQVTA